MDASQDVPRFGYRRMAAWLDVGEARVRRLWRLWRSLRLHQPRKRPRRRRSGCNMRLPEAVRPNSVWSYDFVHDQFVDPRGEADQSVLAAVAQPAYGTPTFTQRRVLKTAGEAEIHASPPLIARLNTSLAASLGQVARSSF
jgi:hypothetical protein